MALSDAQELFSLFFAIYFSLVIDRSHQAYKPWDTYNAWKGKSHNIMRLLAGWIILFFIPILHFSILFSIVGSFDIQFDMTISGILNILFISLGSFFDFGYYRIYEAFLHRYPKSFFSDEERIKLESSGKILPDFWAHFIPGVLYVVLSTLMIWIAIYY